MRLALCLVLALAAAGSSAQSETQIRLNQVGVYPDGPKLAVVASTDATGLFEVVRTSDGASVLSGTLGAGEWWAKSGETVRTADFSALTEPGTYRLRVAGVGDSYPFEVRPNVAGHVAWGLLKSYYFWRASVPIVSPYGGAWTRAAGHSDEAVVVHPSAATAARPAGSTVASPRGWYDAGDYGKYASNTALALSALMTAQESHPGYTVGLEVSIPESGNGVPDLVDEAVWAARWMLTMQDPADGGVYHKLTTAAFTGGMPDQDTATRYVVQKSLEASFGLAASLAQTGRVVADYPGALPGLADSLRTAAVAAWAWALDHPNAQFSQAAMNAQFDPDIRTGEYRAEDIGDFKDWAAAELFVTTGDAAYLRARRPQTGPAPFEGDGEELGNLTLLRNEALVTSQGDGAVDLGLIEAGLLGVADRLAGHAETQPYRVSQGAEDWHFRWGSNASAADQGSRLVAAYERTGETRYLGAATAILDYLLGRNATGFSFVTGYGTRSPRFPHHGQSLNDGLDAPIPGLVVGGPNVGQEDVNDTWGCRPDVYPSTLPAQSYADHPCSFASSEPAVNLNAVVFRFLVALDAARATTASPSVGGQVVAALNAGGGAVTAADGVAYSADAGATGGRTYTTRDPITGTNDDALYQSERYGDFSYQIPVENGDYEVTVQFAEIYWTAPGRRVFDVRAEGQPFASDLDLFASAGHDTATDVTQRVTVRDGVLSLDFATQTDNAKVSAIVARTSGGAAIETDPLSADLETEAMPVRVYPNPAVEVTLEYGLAEATNVRLEVYDALGRRVATLADEIQRAGAHRASIGGGGLAAGVYHWRLQAGARVEMGRFVLTR